VLIFTHASRSDDEMGSLLPHYVVGEFLNGVGISRYLNEILVRNAATQSCTGTGTKHCTKEH
jgi:hypothetical protein